MVSEKFFIFFFFFFEKWHFSFCWRLKKIDSFGHIWFDDFWFCWSCTWSIVIFQTLDWTGWWGKQGEFRSSISMLFYYLAPVQNNSIVTSRWVQFIFGDKGELTWRGDHIYKKNSALKLQCYGPAYFKLKQECNIQKKLSIWNHFLWSSCINKSLQS